MKQWADLTHFAGFDWASEHHDVVVVDRNGAVAADFRFDNTVEGWNTFAERLRPFPAVGMVIETSHGFAVERLLSMGHAVFPINPKKGERYRERKAPSGVKDDKLDAWAFADALRLDGRTWKPLQPEDPVIVELRQLCRDETGLIAQRTALVNQLQQALREYYPTALAAFDDWTKPFAWAFVEKFPSPVALARAGKRGWLKFLSAHRLEADERLACFAQSSNFCGSSGTIAAKEMLALTLVKLLGSLHARLEVYRGRIEELFNKHSDHNIFDSLPGIGGENGKTKARLLGEIGCDRTRFDSAEELQCYAGSAPVTKESGRVKTVHMRRGCNKFLRNAVHWLADLSRRKCAWAHVYYNKKREEGNAHAAALRSLGNRWLKIIWRMWQTRTAYDAELHQRNQLKHGSWVLKLANAGQPQPAHP